MTVAPNPTQPIIEATGRMTQVFRTWTQIITRQTVLSGSGSPEAVIEALPTRLYMDTAGTADAILYVKRDADIAGDKAKGWILT